MSNILELKSNVLDYVFRYGPVLPVQISKYIGSNTIFAGALLSEFIANGKLKVSRAKVGGSPVYYMPGQEPKLTMLFKYLNEREQKAYELLRQKKVLKDSILEPWERVALRELKDFAVMLKSYEDEIFWRWYQIPDKEAESLILDIYKKPEQEKIEVKPEVIEKKEEKIDEIKKEEQEELKVEEEKKPLLEKKEEEKKIEEKKPEEKKEKQVRQKEHKIKREPEKKIVKEKTIKERIKEISDIKVLEREKKPEEKKTKLKKETKHTEVSIEDLDQKIIEYFNNKNIKVLEKEVIKKDKDMEFIAQIPSHIGTVKFYITFKDKKKLSDSDIILEHNKSQLKKLPLLFLTTGEITKKAQDYINKNNLNVEKIE
ncbi:MAG: hypothetical protein V1663_05490 [archaeon]